MFGVVKGRIATSLGKTSADKIALKEYKKAFDNGKMSKEEYNFMEHYIKNPHDKGLNEKATALYSKMEPVSGEELPNVNPISHQVPVEIMNQTNIKNLQNAFGDQALTQMGERYKNSLSDFAIHNDIDRIISKPTIINGLRGYYEHTKGKFDAKIKKLKEADKLLDKHLFTDLKENMEFSQGKILKNIKSSKFKSSHINHLPTVIPKNIKQIIKRDEKINLLKKKIKGYDKKIAKGEKGFSERKESALKDLREQESKQYKILTPKEELQELRKSLLGKKDLPNKWKTSEEYHRLVDLSHSWKNAQTLLDRVHLHAAYEEQEAYAAISKQLIDFADSNVSQFARPDNVTDYVKKRIESDIGYTEPTKELTKKVQEQYKVPEDNEAILQETKENIDKITDSTLKKEINNVINKFKEFKESDKIFDNMIKCVIGVEGG